MSVPKAIPFGKKAVWLALASLCATPAFALDPASPPASSKEAQEKMSKRLMQLPQRLIPRAAEEGAEPNKRDVYEKAYDLFIRYTDGSIYNPTTNVFDPVKLRAYQQKTDKSWDANDANSAKFQAPTVVMEPGQTVRFRLYNQLPEQDAEKCARKGVLGKEDINAPGKPTCFNVTNLHSHGLWVSPSGNSDNVLLSINPNVNFEYEYNVPFDHPAGTFWYHPHTHGTTAMQVGSGMAGALIVEGDRRPTPKKNGDLDTLLKVFQPKDGSSAEVMMLQQIPYACFEGPGYAKIQSTYQGTKDVGPWTCNTGQVGQVESFAQVESPTVWRTSGRSTMVNGQVLPRIEMLNKKVYRWRLIDAGFQDTVKLRIKYANDPAKLDVFFPPPGTKPSGAAQDLEKICDGVDVTQFEVASDGLTHNQTIGKVTNFLQPGYRSDVLFSLPKAGRYCVYDDAASSGLSDAAKNARMLAVLEVAENGEVVADFDENQTTFLTRQLVAAAHKTQREEMKGVIAADLEKGLYLSHFVPHKSFSAARIEKLRGKKKEYVTFDIGPSIDAKPAKTLFMVKGDASLNQPNSVKYTYHANRIDHTLILGDEQIWELSAKTGNHPFHIHVNPFQIISITDTQANDATLSPADKAKRADFARQYKDMIGTWKDTLIVGSGFKIEVATRYQRYVGEYVMHCHILEHEDQGMMQNVKVVLPDGKGGAASGAHQH